VGLQIYSSEEEITHSDRAVVGILLWRPNLLWELLPEMPRIINLSHLVNS
jgi:hypothetical protein